MGWTYKEGGWTYPRIIRADRKRGKYQYYFWKYRAFKDYPDAMGMDLGFEGNFNEITEKEAKDIARNYIYKRYGMTVENPFSEA